MQSKIKENYTPKLPLKTIRRILKYHIEQEVSKEVVEYVRDEVETTLRHLCEDVVKNVDETNRIRARANLPIIKRITLSIYKSLLAQLLKRKTDFDNSSIGQCNIDTMLQPNANKEVM